MLRRLYDNAATEHLDEHEQMLLLSGPRRVGKTTTSLNLDHQRALYYFNWDDPEDRAILLQGARAILDAVEIEQARRYRPVVIFDELHKYRYWKSFLKGFFDKYHYQLHIVVTGSARLDVYQHGGDSLMGRYFQFRIHPLSIRELLDPTLPTELIRPPIYPDEAVWEALWRFGGFPEPYLKGSDTFATRWRRLRRQQLFQEDLRDLTRVQELAQMEVLAEWIRGQIGSQVSYSSLAKHARISVDTARRWIEILRSLYYLFPVRPWANNIPRSLTKEPKYFLWDWSLVNDPGARAENFVASHLLKAIDFWNDYGFGDFGLYYLRNRDQREVDFVVVRDGQPWMLLEVKRSEKNSISSNLHHFATITQAPHIFQVAVDATYQDLDCFALSEPKIVPAKTLLSQLV